jgi:hypothetical protein
MQKSRRFSSAMAGLVAAIPIVRHYIILIDIAGAAMTNWLPRAFSLSLFNQPHSLQRPCGYFRDWGKYFKSGGA